jgi:predicted negative regulator of RcsB-dependent stress response
MNSLISNLSEDLKRRQRISLVVALAECGQVVKAISILDAIPQEERHAEDWDILARIYTQISRLHDARASWEQAERSGMPSDQVRRVLQALHLRRHASLISIVLAGSAVVLLLIAVPALLTLLF